jgi:1,4-dihydroxy-2-naphthoyl-CoA hydrolase
MRIRLNDIDAAGVAFGPQLIAWAHEAVEDVLLGVGVDLAAVIREGAYALPLVRIESDFRAPVRHGDDLQAQVRLVALGETSFRLSTTLTVGTTVVATVIQVHVAIDRAAGRPLPLPVGVRAALERLGLGGG